MRGKLIVIEGTDCSGKETQSNRLCQRLKENNIPCEIISFPAYETPTGKIVGGPYLGKKDICDGFFEEGASNVNPKVSSLYYAADRLYNINNILEMLNNGMNIILDRYTYSNMAHQGGKIEDKKDRENMYEWIEKLEFDFLEMPRCDILIFLHMPIDAANKLKKNRTILDQHEIDVNHLKSAERAYQEVALKYSFYKIECANNEKIRSIDDINDELFSYVVEQLQICNNKKMVL